MQKRFEDWGAGLSDADFACALAALGIVGNADASWTAERLASEIRDRVGRDKRVEWQFGAQRLALDATKLAKAWRLFVLSGGSGVRIQLSRLVLQIQRIDPVWLRDQLLHPAVQVEVVQVFDLKEDDIDSYVPDRGSPGSQSYSFELPDGDVFTISGRGTVYTPARGRRAGGRKPKPSSRYLQAQLYDVTDPRKPELVEKAMRPGTPCRASVFIGVQKEGWKSANRPFPNLTDPPKPQGHRLTVVFEEPGVEPTPRFQVRLLWLPPTGDSEPVTFELKAPEDEASTARVTVLHANRVLQSGLLRNLVGKGRLTFELDAMPRAQLEGLAHRVRFDAALVLNQDHGGTPRLTAMSGNRAAVMPLDDGRLAELTRFLNRQISTISKEPERYATLNSPGTVELLVALAQKGGALREHLFEHTDLQVLADARRIHLTSAKAGSFFPVELLYDFDPPDDDASLCPDALAALRTGTCPGGCSADRRRYVCPVGFWGLSRIIERHAHHREDTRIDGDFLLHPEPVRERSPLVISGKSLLAASSKASEVKSDAVTELHAKLRRRGPATLATTWAEWKARVASERPTLLVLLPHHEQLQDEEVLEIGASDRLKSELVRSDHVRPEGGPSPVVLLLGCETNLSRIAFDNFVTRFRDKGAAVVVSTIATILGRHASPAAARLVELLDEEAREGESTFGEVMVRLRRRLLETESPMALGLTAYGDADWVLVAETS